MTDANGVIDIDAMIAGKAVIDEKAGVDINAVIDEHEVNDKDPPALHQQFGRPPGQPPCGLYSASRVTCQFIPFDFAFILPSLPTGPLDPYTVDSWRSAYALSRSHRDAPTAPRRAEESWGKRPRRLKTQEKGDTERRIHKAIGWYSPRL